MEKIFKMKYLMNLTFCAFCIIGFLGYSGCMILTHRHVVQYDLEEVWHDNDKLTLIVSGSSIHSAYTVRKIKVSQKGEVLKCRVYLVLAGSGTDSFRHEFEVPENVSTVVFGKEETVIWNRKGLAAPRENDAP